MADEIIKSCMYFGPLMTGSECASWVQAWGSILAILISVGGAALSFWLSSRNEFNRQHVLAYVNAGYVCNRIIGDGLVIHDMLDEITILLEKPQSERSFFFVKKLKNMGFYSGEELVTLFPLGMKFVKNAQATLSLHRIALKKANECEELSNFDNSSLNDLRACLRSFHKYRFEVIKGLVDYTESKANRQPILGAERDV